MDEIKKTFYIKNFLSQDEINILWQYMQVKHASNNSNFDDSQTSFGETALYGSSITDGLLLLKKDIFEKMLNKKLLPTYSFWRIYTKYSDLKKHTDRGSCEITASITIKSDLEWPIYIDGKKVIIKEGDAALYFGMELEHWREPYEGDYCAQIFLHYVQEDGQFKDFVYDKRKYLGFKKQ